MKNKRIITAIMLSSALSSVLAINVYSEISKLSRNDYIKSYTKGSPEYSVIDKSIQKNILGGYEIENSLVEIDNQIEASENRIKGYREEYKKTDITPNEKFSVQVSIDSETISGFELRITKAKYEMQNEIQKLYEEYSPDIQKQQEDSFKYQAVQKFNSAKSYEARIGYLEAQEALKEKEIAIEKARFETGYSKQTDVDLLSAELTAITAEKDIYQAEYDTLIFELDRNGKYDISNIGYDYSIDDKVSYDNLISGFKKNDYNSDHTKAEIKIYEDYIKKLDEISKEFTDPAESQREYAVIEDISEYYERVSGSIDSEIEYYKNEIELKKLSDEVNAQNLELYVYTLCSQYNSLISQISAKESEILSAKSQAEIVEVLFNEGRAIEVEVMNADVQIKKLELDRAELLIQLDNLRYLLDNLIVGQ